MRKQASGASQLQQIVKEAQASVDAVIAPQSQGLGT